VRKRPIKLLTYKGNTVDFKLREFRHIIVGKIVKFIPFDSKQGDKLLLEFIRNQQSQNIR
jgi:hypothetical protein